jgi:hypothetical protein
MRSEVPCETCTSGQPTVEDMQAKSETYLSAVPRLPLRRRPISDVSLDARALLPLRFRPPATPRPCASERGPDATMEPLRVRVTTAVLSTGRDADVLSCVAGEVLIVSDERRRRSRDTAVTVAVLVFDPVEFGGRSDVPGVGVVARPSSSIGSSSPVGRGELWPRGELRRKADGEHGVNSGEVLRGGARRPEEKNAE